MINNVTLSSVISQNSPLKTFIKNPINSNSQFTSLLIAKFPQNNVVYSRSSSFRPIYCSSSSPGTEEVSEKLNPAGNNDNKTVLDAFFLGKALGEALTERIESTVGEVLSTIGRLQAEQQKQVLEFQEDVLERAKKAKEKASREALEEQGRLISNASTRAAAEVNGTISSSPPSVLSPDEPGSVGDENQINSEPSDSITSIEIDE